MAQFPLSRVGAALLVPFFMILYDILFFISLDYHLSFVTLSLLNFGVILRKILIQLLPLWTAVSGEMCN